MHACKTRSDIVRHYNAAARGTDLRSSRLKVHVIKVCSKMSVSVHSYQKRQDALDAYYIQLQKKNSKQYQKVDPYQIKIKNCPENKNNISRAIKAMKVGGLLVLNVFHNGSNELFAIFAIATSYESSSSNEVRKRHYQRRNLR